MREAVQVFHIPPEVAVEEQIILHVRYVEGRQALIVLRHPAPNRSQGVRPAEIAHNRNYAVASLQGADKLEVVF